jgi:DNA polymerase III alpha subunit
MVNEAILNLAKEFDVKVVATNDVHFINAEDADAHDLLICLNTGKDLDDPPHALHQTGVVQNNGRNEPTLRPCANRPEKYGGHCR